MNPEPFKLFNLPTYVLAPILIEWFERSEVHRLYKAAIRSSRFERILAVRILRAIFFEYLYNRNVICIDKLFSVGVLPINRVNLMQNKLLLISSFRSVRTKTFSDTRLKDLLKYISRFIRVKIDVGFKGDFLFFLFVSQSMFKFTSLTSLHIARVAAKVPTLIFVLPQLNELTIECESRNVLYSVVVHARKVTKLNLIAPRMSARDLSIFGFHGFPSLVAYTTNACEYTNTSFQTFLCSKASKLESLSLDRTRLLTDGFVRGLKGAFLKLNTLSLSLCDNIGDDGLVALLSCCPYLESLNLTRNVHTEDFYERAGLPTPSVMTVLDNCNVLRKLSLDGLLSGRHNRIIYTIRCSTLTFIKLRECNVDDALFRAIFSAQSSTNLTYLDLSKNYNLLALSLRELTRFVLLTELNLACCVNLSDEVVYQLSLSCVQLKSLNVSSSDVTDQGLQAALLNCVSLVSLRAEYLQRCDILVVIDSVIRHHAVLERLVITTHSGGDFKEYENKMRDNVPGIDVFIRTEIQLEHIRVSRTSPYHTPSTEIHLAPPSTQAEVGTNYEDDGMMS